MVVSSSSFSMNGREVQVGARESCGAIFGGGKAWHARRLLLPQPDSRCTYLTLRTRL